MLTARFNGRHMTAIVSAVCVAIILAPVAVLASSAPRSTAIQKVYVTDPHNSAHKASVSSTGALSVGGTVNVGNLPASQNVNGTVNVGNLPSTQNVSGAVTAVPGLPGTPFTKTAVEPASITVPTGKHLVIETASVSVDVTSGNSLYVELDYTTGGVPGYLYLPVTYSYTCVATTPTSPPSRSSCTSIQLRQSA